MPKTGSDQVEYVGLSPPVPPNADGSRFAPYRYTVPSVPVTFQYAWFAVLLEPPVVPDSNCTRVPSSTARRHFEVSVSSRTSSPACEPPEIVAFATPRHMSPELAQLVGLTFAHGL